MSENKRTEINRLGEFELIHRLTNGFEQYQGNTVKGIGDDAAVIDNSGEMTLISTDMMVEGIHFDLMYTPLKHLGYKSIVTNLSDIYAMNGTPRQVTVSIALSNRFSLEAVEELYSGMRSACKRYKVDLIGGDTSSSQKGLFISVTAIGQATNEEIVYRNTALPGDIICVSGDLGGAYVGLQILEREKAIFLENPDFKPELEDNAYIIGRQLKPEPRADLIYSLRQAGIKPTAMIDISDGLASDLLHICTQSNVGAVIKEAQVPIHTVTEQQAIKFRLDPITCALNGGEDYELLFTLHPDDLDKIQGLSDVYIIGSILPPEDGVLLETSGGNFHKIIAQGWDHFDESTD
jgi:thiamine-monophosphate kinase